jgi:hypothetical protein
VTSSAESYHLTFDEAVREHEQRAGLIATDGERYATVDIPWGFECGEHSVERSVCRCGFPDGPPIGNDRRNGITERDRVWINRRNHAE